MAGASPSRSTDPHERPRVVGPSRSSPARIAAAMRRRVGVSRHRRAVPGQQMLRRDVMQRDCLGDEVSGMLPHDTGEQVRVPEAGGAAAPVERVRAGARVADRVRRRVRAAGRRRRTCAGGSAAPPSRAPR